MVGAPYLDGKALKAHLDALALPGVDFEAITFTPTASVFKGKTCQGVRVHLNDAKVYQSVDTGLAIATYLSRHHAEACQIEKFKTLLLHPQTYQMVREGKAIDAIRKTWQPELDAFKARRRACLLY